MRARPSHGQRTKALSDEESLSTLVSAAAERGGWRRMHPRPARTDEGWRTAIEGDAGYPDWTLVWPGPANATVLNGRLVIAELKGAHGTMRPGQREWLSALRCVPAVETFLWTPADADEIVAVLVHHHRVSPRPFPWEL